MEQVPVRVVVNRHLGGDDLDYQTKLQACKDLLRNHQAHLDILDAKVASYRPPAEPLSFHGEVRPLRTCVFGPRASCAAPEGTAGSKAGSKSGASKLGAKTAGSQLTKKGFQELFESSYYIKTYF